MSSQIDSKFTNPEYEIEKKSNITIVKMPITYIDMPPTEEQKEKILQFDEEFKCRYTDDDKDYADTIKSCNPSPPLVTTYMVYSRRDNRRGVKRSSEDPISYRNKYPNYHNRQDYNNDNRR